MPGHPILNSSVSNLKRERGWRVTFLPCSHEWKSSLRPKDEPEPEPGPSRKQRDLQAYLEAKYSSKPTAKKKKKKTKTKPPSSSLFIVDNDVTGFAPVEETIKVKEVDLDAPMVVNASEVAALERMQKEREANAKKGTWHTVQEDEEMCEGVREMPKEDMDFSPPRRTLYDPPSFDNDRNEMEDMSPPRREQSERVNDLGDADLSPPRRSTQQDRDMSPPRRPKSQPQRNAPEKRRMMDGTSTGVINPEQMKDEIRKKRRADKERLYGLDDQATGKGAETVYRNRDGKRVTLEELEKERAKEKKKVKWEKVEWDSGLVQQQNAKRYKAEFELERAKPFARQRDDEDLDAMYRARRRWGDPMGHLDKKARSTNPNPELPPIINETNRQWFEKSGFVIPQEIPEHSWIRRGVAALSNRYNIRPGRHWDGVDRSNGFEKDYAKYLNECAARDKEAAQWCMEDM